MQIRTLNPVPILCLSLLLAAGCADREDMASRQGAAVTPAVTDSAAQAADMRAAFRRFLDDNYAEDMARSPATASYRGIKDRHDQWNSAAESFQQDSRDIYEARLRKLADFDPALLDESGRLSLAIYRLDLQRQIAADEFRHHDFIMHQYNGPHTQVPSFLINIHTIADRADAEAYIGRLNNVGRLFDEVIGQLRIREQKRLLLADWQYPMMIEASTNVISGAPFDDTGRDSALLADFRAKVTALELEADQRAKLLVAAEQALVDVLAPAYRRLIAELERLAPLASGDDGVWKFDHGDAFYAERLRWFTTTDLDAGAVHALGLSEVQRIHGEMRAIMERIGFKGTLAEFFQFVRDDARFYYPNTDAGRAAYLAEVDRVVGAMRARLPEMFGLLPKAELIVKRVEEFRERSAGKAFYQGPPPDGSRPGIYYANLLDMADMPNYQLEALAFHEGLPGHHMQRAIAVELQGIPEFQKYTSFTAYTEGWGLYTEQLAREMGFYEDPYSDFGRLAMELWRACRLVVDTGLHARRWTRQRAIDYLVENTPNSVGDSTKAIERYIAMPGQATAYLVGKIRIIKLRERARAALGTGFDIRRFHDEVLKDGPVPLSLLEEKIDAFIAAGT